MALKIWDLLLRYEIHKDGVGWPTETGAWTVWARRDTINVREVSAIGLAKLYEGVRNFACRKIGKQVGEIERHGPSGGGGVNSELPEPITYRCLPLEAVKRLSVGGVGSITA